MECRVTIQWTQTAKDSLKALPKKVRAGILAKGDELLKCGDPRDCYKPLLGPLSGHYRLVYSRYRAVFRADEEKLASGDLVLHVKVVFITVGIRKEFDKNDVYAVARKLVETVLDPDADIE